MWWCSIKSAPNANENHSHLGMVDYTVINIPMKANIYNIKQPTQTPIIYL